MPITVASARERLLAECLDEVGALKEAGRYRRLRCLEAVDGPVVRIEGRELVCWCANDYLGLSTHPALAQAAAETAAAWGVGARASRLLGGTSQWHVRLEESLAAWCGAEAALSYASGYLANLGTLGALLSSQDAVIVDRLAHASLFDAARGSRARLRVFRHNDASHAAELLSRARGFRRRVIVTEGVFSMEGDRAPLEELVTIAEAHDALVYLDDAHGAFVLGESGRGAPEAAGVSMDRVLYMGAMGKALGCQGGFVAGPAPLIDLLRNRARAFIYTTALAVPVAAAAVAALTVLRDEPDRRARLWSRARALRRRLGALPAVSLPEPSHILPIVVGQVSLARELAERLWSRGIWAPAIRPPTVSERTARLRLSVTALHTDAQIDQLARALEEFLSAHFKTSGDR
ncbi:MAG: 8-amino-7-oxononanoate synthase [Candidatus Omnitrophota bacterium]|nr:8-amino-7-oxononanoate synthase [Candidatus Omnitrophota bacterium]